MKSDTYFAVTYRYYQYNGDSADNGHYTAEKRCATAEAASALAAAINAAARRHKEADDRINAEQLARARKQPFDVPEIEIDEDVEYADRQLANDLISGAGGGYLISAEAQIVRTERKALQSGAGNGRKRPAVRPQGRGRRDPAAGDLREGRSTREQALAASRTVLIEAARIDGIRKDILQRREGMKKYPSAAQFATRHANAVRIADKVSGLIAAGYRVFDELGDQVLNAGKRDNGDVVFALKDGGNVLMFMNDPTLDNGALDGVKQFNKFFEGWSFLHPKDVKTLKV